MSAEHEHLSICIQLNLTLVAIWSETNQFNSCA